MDLDKKTLLTAGVALVVGFILGGSRGGEDMNAQIAAAIEGTGAPVAALSGGVDGIKGDIAALNDRIAALEAAVAAAGSASGDAAAAAAASEGEATRAAVAEVGAAVTGIATTMAERHKMMDERYAQMQMHRAHMQAQMQGAAPAAPAAAPAAEAEPAPAAEPESPPEGHRVGQTAIFEDGALRVFVGKVNADAGTVRVAINGLAQTEIDIFGGTASVDLDGRSCTVGVSAIDRGHAALTAECG